jgi:glycosyltransferase involved in cell wall biosynthesis
MDVACIMSVYRGDSVSQLLVAVDSILAQVRVSVSLYIFVDGVVDKNLEKNIRKYEAQDCVQVLWSKENLGLSVALNTLVDKFSLWDKYRYIARMDSDDQSSPERLYKQVSYMVSNGLDVCGTNCIEVDEKGIARFQKIMPETHLAISKVLVRRSPFVHPSVMFSSRIFKDGHRYNEELLNTQDYYFWVDLFCAGYKFGNLQEYLLNFRMGAAFFKKRGLSKSLNDFKGRLYAIKALKDYRLKNYIFAISLLLLRLSPAFVSQFAYLWLRKGNRVSR